MTFISKQAPGKLEWNMASRTENRLNLMLNRIEVEFTTSCPPSFSLLCDLNYMAAMTVHLAV